VPSIYLHFEDKQALLDAVCSEVFDALHVRLKEASAGAPDAWQGLRRQGVAYVQFALENPEHYRIVMMGRPTTMSADEEIASGAFAHLLDTVQSCVALGVLEGDPIQLGMQLWAAAHGIAALLIAKPMFPWPPIEQLVDDAICAAGSGLAARSRLNADQPAADRVKKLNRLR
jgi:AcrR family transcriptional regulator